MATHVTPVYQGKIVHLNLETIELPNGRTCELEIVHHPGGAAVVVLDEDNNVCLLRQYRHAAGGWLWELPAGKLESAEETLVTAKRELEEEAGVRAKEWEPLGLLISSPGVFTEHIHLYLARGLEITETDREEHELIEVHWVPFPQALDWATSGEIQDAKTLIGLYRAREFLYSTVFRY